MSKLVIIDVSSCPSFDQMEVLQKKLKNFSEQLDVIFFDTDIVKTMYNITSQEILKELKDIPLGSGAPNLECLLPFVNNGKEIILFSDSYFTEQDFLENVEIITL